MISDVLSDAVQKINRYLDQFSDVYEGEIRERIIACRDERERVRKFLDAAPAGVDGRIS